MARCYCRWRNVLICMCTPCILFALLFVYVTLVVCFSMGHPPSSTSTARLTLVHKTHFIAPGTYLKEGLAPLPKTFWDPTPHRGAVWNQLQLAVDRHYNPILSRNHIQNGHKSAYTTFDSQLRASISGIGNLESKMHNFATLPQQMREFVTSMHWREYPVLIEPTAACGAGAEDEKVPPLLLLAIKTEEVNFANRQAIRQTWGKAGWVSGKRGSGRRGEGEKGEGIGGGDGGEGGAYIRRVFLLGKGSLDESGVDMSELLALESKHYGDILQWDFKDSFFNLTLKDVLFWGWFSRLCPRTRFVFKGDDDVFVNTPNMVDYLQEQLRKPGSSKAMTTFMVGDVIGAAEPIRANKSKYCVPDSFYKGLYPTYAGGGGVVYSGLLTKRLGHISRRVHLFPIDDVYVGMCMLRLNAYPNHNPAFLTFGFPKKKEAEPCAYHTILLVHKRSPSQITKLWVELKKTQRQCWNASLIDNDKENDAKVKDPLKDAFHPKPYSPKNST